MTRGSGLWPGVGRGHVHSQAGWERSFAHRSISEVLPSDACGCTLLNWLYLSQEKSALIVHLNLNSLQ